MGEQYLLIKIPLPHASWCLFVKNVFLRVYKDFGTSFTKLSVYTVCTVRYIIFYGQYVIKLTDVGAVVLKAITFQMDGAQFQNESSKKF